MRSKKLKKNLIMGVLAFVVLLSGLVISSNEVSADSYSGKTKGKGDEIDKDVLDDNTFIYQDIVYKIISNDEIAVSAVDDNLIKTIHIPDVISYNNRVYKVTCIFDEGFKDCKLLKKVTIGKNVNTFGEYAFENCKNLKNIIIKSTELTKTSIGKNAFKDINKKATFRCPNEQLKNYKKWLGKAQAPKTAKYKNYVDNNKANKKSQKGVKQFEAELKEMKFLFERDCFEGVESLLQIKKK